MGRTEEGDKSRKGNPRKKSKGRMSYLRRQRNQPAGADGGGGPPPPPREPKTDEFGQLYGDYEPVNYGPKHQHWRNRRPGGGDGGGVGGYRGSRGYRGGGGDAGHHGRGGGRFQKPLLKVGMKGFLCTTNFNERECVIEAYNILNEYSDGDVKKEEVEGKVKSDPEAVAPDVNKEGEKSMECEPSAPPATESVDEKVVKVLVEIEKEGSKVPEVSQSTEAGSGEGGAEKKDIDVDEELANELEELKSDRAVWKFKNVSTKLTNVVLISTTIDDPTELAHKIFDDVTAKKEAKTRHVLRFLPIELTCYANSMDEVKPKLKEVLEKHLKTGYVSYRIVFNSRYNGKLERDDFIMTVADMISKINPLSFVDLDNPQYTIAVEVLKGIMCVGVVKDFVKFKKYNLLEAGTAKAVPEKEIKEKEKGNGNGQGHFRRRYYKPRPTGGRGSAPGSSSNSSKSGKDAEDEVKPKDDIVDVKEEAIEEKNITGGEEDGKTEGAITISKSVEVKLEEEGKKAVDSAESVSTAEIGGGEGKPESKKEGDIEVAAPNICADVEMGVQASEVTASVSDVEMSEVTEGTGGDQKEGEGDGSTALTTDAANGNETEKTATEQAEGEGDSKPTQAQVAAPVPVTTS